MSASQLRHRVTLTAVSRGRDSMGGVTETAGDAVTVWASVEPVSARESQEKGALSVRPTHRVIIRHRAGVSHRMRVTFDGRVFDVIEVQDAGLRNQFLTLLVAAQQAGAQG